MRTLFGQGPTATQESHRVTSFEIFFDLVFVFAIIRVVSFMTHSLTFLTLAQGLILLLLLWWSWSAYAWVGNQAKADQGLMEAGMVVAMAALFIAGLVMPDAFGGGPIDAPLILALALAVVRVVYNGLYLYAAVGDRRLRAQLLLGTIPLSAAWIAFIVGALIGGTAQTLLWAAAIVIDYGGGRVTSSFSGYQLRSPRHFSERHGLILIIALGESLISIGEGTGPSVTGWLVLAAGTLGVALAVCLYVLYFAQAKETAESALTRAPEARRIKIARDAYTFAHFPMIAGILYIAVGIQEVLIHITHGGSPTAGEPLGWPAATALYAGAAMYLVGRAAFLRLSAGPFPAAQLPAAAVALILLPAARYLPALAALGLITALVAGQAGYEQLNPQSPNTTAASNPNSDGQQASLDRR
jgi:low temperature requirement protein LtrA